MENTANSGTSVSESTESVNTESVESTESPLESSQEAGSSQELPTDSKIEAKKEEIKALKKKLKLKVDGQEIEEEVDFDNDDYLTKQLQLAKVSQKRMNEYAALEKDVRNFIEELRKNPKKVLADPNIGIDVKQLAAQIIEEEIENSKKSPEQLEKEKLETELKALKEEREKEKEEHKKKELERLQQAEYERYDMLITKALEKSDLPKSDYIVKKIADYMLLGLQSGQDVTPDDVIPLVREDMTNDLKAMFAVMPEEVIESIIGKDVINKLRKKKVAAAKAGIPPAPVNKLAPDTGKAAEKKSEDSSKSKKTFKDFFGV